MRSERQVTWYTLEQRVIGTEINGVLEKVFRSRKAECEGKRKFTVAVNGSHLLKNNGSAKVQGVSCRKRISANFVYSALLP